MKILFAINHPAHYHFLKHITINLRKKGHIVEYVIKNKDILEDLMISENQNYHKLLNRKKSKNNPLSILLNLSIQLIHQNYKLLKFCKEFVPDILAGTDISITHIGKIINRPSFVFNEDDYEINKFFCKASYPFASFIVSPDVCDVGRYKHKKIEYRSYQKLAYMHPNYFVPQNDIVKNLGLKDRYFIIRIVSLTAGHDIEGKHRGITSPVLDKIIIKLQKYGKIIISAEDRLPSFYGKYRFDFEPNLMHHLMFYADLFIGDSQSMCAEAGLLGTPFIRYNDFVGKIGYLNDIENNFELGFGIKPGNEKQLEQTIDNLLANDKLKQIWQQKRDRLLDQKIDFTAFITELFDNYPDSINEAIK